MTDQALPMPARQSSLGRMVRSFALLRESRIGMMGLGIVLFWLVLAVTAPLLP